MSRASVELGRLNEAEQRVLLLLAQGHTAKSIASAIGSTPTAVYERLREARRKTGAGSSRELARLLRAQEDNDKLLGIGSPAEPVISVGSQSRAVGSGNRKVIAMIALLLASLAVGLALQQTESSNIAADAASFSDPVVGNIFAPADPALVALLPTTERDYVRPRAGATVDTEKELRRLHALIRTERRDEQAETRLAAIYKSIHPIKLSSAPLRVICSKAVCEVATTTQPRSSQPELDATLGEVQGAELRQAAEAMGLRPLYMFFGLHPIGDRAAYLAYWARTR